MQRSHTYQRLCHTAWLLVLIALPFGLFLPSRTCAEETPGAGAGLSAVVNTDDAAVTVKFGHGVVLTLALDQKRLLGLHRATVDDVALRSDQTVVRPLLVQEWVDKPVIWDVWTLEQATADEKQVVVTFTASPRRDRAHEAVFVLDTKSGKPHLDSYRFAHVQLPAEMAKVDAVRAQVSMPTTQPIDGGKATLRWVFEPAVHNIGGFTWKGWSHRYEVDLPDGYKLNGIREVGTWETLGQAVGNTLVACRYRGMGNLAEKLEPMAPSSTAVRNSFNTPDVIPGKAGGSYAISPVSPGPVGVLGRDEALKNRHGAWILYPQRGAGANWIDFQYRSTVGLTSFYSHMDAIRSMTEIFPGDAQVSFTDHLLFHLTQRIISRPKTFLALVRKNQPLPEHEWQTRYQELDLHVRDILCRDLNFVQHDPLPSYGINWDSGWAFRIPNEGIGTVEKLARAGVRRVLTHHPGWFNGRGLRQKETSFPIPQRMLPDPKKPDAPLAMRNDTGGDCSIHDYIPQSDKVRELWLEYVQKLNQHDIEYWVWITGMIYGTGPIVEQFGEARFCRNSPDMDYSSGYPGQNGLAGHRGIPMRDPQIRSWWESRMRASSEELGVSGFWADSFQNMFMSQMNYQHSDWAPHVREWWQWIAERSRAGVGWMAESHSFPGLSCSIEVGNEREGYEGYEWTLLYSTRWYRGGPVPFKGTPRANAVFFRTMANKGPIAAGNQGGPEGIDQIPDFRRLSDEYMAALPAMHRPYQLPENRGVLWLTFAGDQTGVLFAFETMAVPAGVEARPILASEGKPLQGDIAALTTVRVSGTDLLTAFGLQRGDAKDPRLGREYQAPKRFMKSWDHATTKPVSGDAAGGASGAAGN